MRWTALPDTQQEPSDTADDWAVLGDGVPEAVAAEGEDEAVAGLAATRTWPRWWRRWTAAPPYRRSC